MNISGPSLDQAPDHTLYIELSGGRRLDFSTSITFWAFVGQCPREMGMDTAGPQEICRSVNWGMISVNVGSL